MSQIQIIPLPYFEDSSVWFLALEHLPNPIWLDSGRPLNTMGRYDVLVADPILTLKTEGNRTQILYQNGTEVFSEENPFTLISKQIHSTTEKTSWPFVGGMVGYWAYDLAWQLENLPRKNTSDIQLPEMLVGLYPWAVIQDHEQKKSVLLINQSIDPSYNFSYIREHCQNLNENQMFHDLRQFIKTGDKTFKINKLISNLNVEKYSKIFSQVKDYIASGDCYQINLAQRFSSRYSGNPLEAYLYLRQQLPSPFSAFMQWKQGSVLSFSPERFLQLRNRQIETKPIKGTIARGKTPEEDKQNADWLKSSLKNRAENVMIVDLLRNDLSKHASKVEVPALCELQSFTNVHHLVSTVTGQLKPDSTAIDLLRDAFPGGSITGAPKIRAMEIIEELEPSQRSIYCGSIGYISVDGQMDTNIAIRTLVCDSNNIHCWGGGGIVADSDCEKEYQETFAKVELILRSLEDKFS